MKKVSSVVKTKFRYVYATRQTTDCWASLQNYIVSPTAFDSCAAVSPEIPPPRMTIGDLSVRIIPEELDDFIFIFIITLT